MKIKSNELVIALAREMKSLGIEKETGLAMARLLDTEAQGKELLEYLKEEQPTDDQVIFKKIKIIIGLAK